MVASRNTVSDFMDRTLRNLKRVEKEVDQDPHAFFEVTQLINSAVGMIIFPYENALEKIPEIPIVEFLDHDERALVLFGDPSTMSTLRGCIKKLRHSLAHYNVQFENYNNEIVGVYLWTYPHPKALEPDFVAYVSTVSLKKMVLKAAHKIGEALEKEENLDRLKEVEVQLGMNLRLTNSAFTRHL